MLYRRLFLVTLTLACGCKQQEHSAPQADAIEPAEILDIAADVTAVDAAVDASAVDAADAASDTSAVVD